MELPVLYLDDDILVVNKPAGLVSNPGGFGRNETTVQSVLEPKYGRLWLVHRLDRDTTGTMVLARNESAHRQLNMAFDRRDPRKIYLALVLGRPGWTEFHCDQPLEVNADRAHRTRFSSNGKPSSTDFRLLGSNDSISLVEASPHTGLTHQIRSHLAGLGHPILMDTLYSTKVQISEVEELLMQIHANYPLRRSALHARVLQLDHPRTGESLRFDAPIPLDMQEIIQFNHFSSNQ
jgi:RluA family pseudouridine synthase